MATLSLESLIVGTLLLASALVLMSVVATWVFRVPGTTIDDFIHGPKGQHAPRFFHTAADALRLVRPERRRLVYWCQLAGISIFALTIVGLVVAGLLFPEAGK